MGRAATQEMGAGTDTGLTPRSNAAKPEYPVREYIAGMTQELAQMARWDGDEVLAGLLDAVTLRAEGARP